MTQEFVTFFFSWNFGLRTALGDFSWWASSWHCTVNLPTFGLTWAGWAELKEKASVSQNTNNVCGDLPGFLCTRMWISPSIFGMKDAVLSLFVLWKSLKADWRLERRKEFPCNDWIPCALNTFFIFTIFLPRRSSYSHFINWKAET